MYLLFRSLCTHRTEQTLIFLIQNQWIMTSPIVVTNRDHTSWSPFQLTKQTQLFP